VLISHHFHDCKAPLARASHVKWRCTKYLGFSFLAFARLCATLFGRGLLTRCYTTDRRRKNC